MHLAPGTPSITPARGPLAGAQSRGHVAARQPGKLVWYRPAEVGKGAVSVWPGSLQAGAVSVGSAWATALSTGSRMNTYC